MPRAPRTRLLFRVLFRVARLLDRAGRAFFYFAAGTLRRADLERMAAMAWNDFGNDDHVAASGLMPWERAIVQEFLKPTDRVLLVGCGSGRDLLPLRQAGYDVVGVEPATQAVERARRLLGDHNLPTDIIAARFDHAELPGKFDAIVFSWFSYCYIPGTAERTAALAKARAHLNPGGRVIISYIASATRTGRTHDDDRADGLTAHRFRLASGTERSSISVGWSHADVHVPTFVRAGGTTAGSPECGIVGARGASITRGVCRRPVSGCCREGVRPWLSAGPGSLGESDAERTQAVAVWWSMAVLNLALASGSARGRTGDPIWTPSSDRVRSGWSTARTSTNRRTGR